MNQQNQNGVQQNQANAYRQTNAGTTGYGYTPNQYVQRQGQPSVPYQQQTAVQYPARALSLPHPHSAILKQILDSLLFTALAYIYPFLKTTGLMNCQ